MMNFAHLHLVLTHFPPVIGVGGAIVAAAGCLLPRRRRDLVRLAALLLAVAGALTPIVFLAGNRAANEIGRVEGINQDAIAPHQRAASMAVWISIGAGVLSLIAVRKEITRAMAVLILIAAIASAAVIGWTAALGGEIHHPEIHQKV